MVSLLTAQINLYSQNIPTLPNLSITGTTVVPLHTFYVKINEPYMKGTRTFTTQLKLNISKEKIDTLYQIEFRWSRNSAIPVQFSADEIIQFNNSLSQLNSIDLSSMPNGTKYQYVLPNRIVLYVEKNSKGLKQMYFVIPKAGGNNPNYYDYDTLTMIFGPLKDYVEKGVIQDWPTEAQM